MRRRFLILLLLLAPLVQITAQTLSRANVAKVTLRGSGSIIQDGQVKGYYSFYDLEKKDKKNNNYQLSVYDENLREINSINIVRPKSYVVLDGAFNGSAFCFLFYDTKIKNIELVSFDRTLAQLGTFTQPVAKNRFAMANYTLIAQGSSPTQAYLIGIQDQGFLHYGLTKDRYQYQTEFYDNTMKRVWSDVAPNGKQVEIASEAFQQDNYVGSLIMIKKNATSKDVDVDLLVQDVITGKKLFRVPVATAKYSVSFSDVYFDQEKGNFIVFGEYYNKNEKELKAQSLGFISIRYDLTGKIIDEKTNSWATDISRVAPVNEKGKFDGSNTSVLFHDIIRTADGQFFAVGEQYKKAVNGAGVALNILSIAAAAAGGGGVYSTASSTQLNIYNMVIFQFNPDFTINKIHFFEKDKNEVLLPSGSGFTASKQLSFYAKAVGGFDYVYTQESKDKNTFVVTYVNYDREKGEKGKNMLGSVIYTPEKTFIVDKLVLDRKSSSYFVSRAKEGYVMVTEYFKKEKRLDSRLEKLNY
jgi:hypothetical protein